MAPVRARTVTPDGDDAFALAGLTAVLRLAPAGGPAAWVTTLPEVALGLTATDDRLYTVDALGDRVWGLDRQRGALAQTLATGRGPTGLVLARGSSLRWRGGTVAGSRRGARRTPNGRSRRALAGAPVSDDARAPGNFERAARARGGAPRPRDGCRCQRPGGHAGRASPPPIGSGGWIRR